MVELRHLRYFVAVAEELNFTRAAERLHTAQPSLSQQIRSLEDYLGTSLLTRSKRKVQLTSAGIRFLDDARLALAQAEKAVIRARQTREMERLKIGFTPSLIVTLLPRLMSIIDLHCPGAQLITRCLSRVELDAALKEEELDLIFTDAMPDDPELTVERLFQDPLIAIFPKTHALAAHDGDLSLGALLDHPIIVEKAASASALREHLAGASAAGGVDLAIEHEVDNLFEALALVLSGRGVGLLESSARQLVSGDLAHRRLEAPGATVDVAIAYRRLGKERGLGEMRSPGETQSLARLIDIAREIGLPAS